MSITPDQTIGRALQRATDGIGLPPESRWLPVPRARSGAMSALTVIAAALLIVAAGIGINSFRQSRVVSGQQLDAFRQADDAAWAQVRAGYPAAVILRPTWIPDEFKQTSSTECPSPQVSIQNASGNYVVSYYGTWFFNKGDKQGARGFCTRLELKTLKVRPEDSFYGVQLVDVAPISARGTMVRVRVGPIVLDRNDLPHQLIYLNWLENGTSYELNTLDVDLTDLTRVLRGLEPMR
jgi:hypothetical protein